MMGLFSAIRFLTIIPIGKRQDKASGLAASLIYFPVVGLFLGLVLAICSNFFTAFGLGEIPSAAIVIILLVILTGGLHLDGLADTADALLSGRKKDEILKIMRDPHIGTMGVLAIVTVILLKIALLSSISLPFKGTSLALMCVAGRWSLVFSLFAFNYTRTEGKAKAFSDGIDVKKLVIATIIALGLSVFLGGMAGLIVVAITSVAAYAIGRSVSRKTGGITGDALGAINELSETLVLLAICFIEKADIWIR